MHDQVRLWLAHRVCFMKRCKLGISVVSSTPWLHLPHCSHGVELTTEMPSLHHP